MKYSIIEFREDFSDEDKCLEWLKNSLHPRGITCKKCKKRTDHHRMKNRKSYSCQKCGNHVHPTAGTIFHKSSTPLNLWFEAIFIMTATRSGVSAKQLERTLGVTYKTAWRIFHQIRKMMTPDDTLSGEVEIDEAYMQPNSIWLKNKQKTHSHNSQILLGMVERGKGAKVIHVKKAGKALIPEIEKTVDKSVQLYSDSYQAYKVLWWMGYKHSSVNHMKKEFVRDEVHTQNVENLWSNMKRGIRGVYRKVDPKYLQAYANEYAYRYSHRNDVSMFWSLMNQIRSYDSPS